MLNPLLTLSPSLPPAQVQPKAHPDDNHVNSEDDQNSEFPPCPAFIQIAPAPGRHIYCYFPISIGATLAYLRSVVPLLD